MAKPRIIGREAKVYLNSSNTWKSTARDELLQTLMLEALKPSLTAGWRYQTSPNEKERTLTIYLALVMGEYHVELRRHVDLRAVKGGDGNALLAVCRDLNNEAKIHTPRWFVEIDRWLVRAIESATVRLPFQKRVIFDVAAGPIGSLWVSKQLVAATDGHIRILKLGGGNSVDHEDRMPPVSLLNVEDAEPFRREIMANPGDAIPRMIFSDWLEEKGRDEEWLAALRDEKLPWELWCKVVQVYGHLEAEKNPKSSIAPRPLYK